MANTEPNINNDQPIAIAHGIINEPERWESCHRPDSFVAQYRLTDGYNFVSMDGTVYGMGVASYQSTLHQREDILKPAIAKWMSPIDPAKEISTRNVQELTEDGFVTVVRAAYVDYFAHMDPVIFTNAVGAALRKLGSQQ